MNGPSPLISRLAARRALIFDFDGTIADSSGLHTRAFSAALAPHGVAIEYEVIAGLKTRDAVVRAFARAGRDIADGQIDAIAADKQARVRALIAAELQPKPGVMEFLVWAKPRHRLAICSSGSRATLELSLNRLALDGWFDPIICAEDVHDAKPAPEGFQKALAALGCPPTEALVFEDSDAGLAAAAAAGLEAIDVRPPFLFPAGMDAR